MEVREIPPIVPDIEITLTPTEAADVFHALNVWTKWPDGVVKGHNSIGTDFEAHYGTDVPNTARVLATLLRPLTIDHPSYSSIP